MTPFTVLEPVSDRVMIADAILSTGNAYPPYANLGNNYSSVPGGFSLNGGSTKYPHTSPHLKSGLPQGGHEAFKDGHVTWHKFTDQVNPMVQRGDIGGPYFWW
jgi:hypothetical protein